MCPICRRSSRLTKARGAMNEKLDNVDKENNQNEVNISDTCFNWMILMVFDDLKLEVVDFGGILLIKSIPIFLWSGSHHHWQQWGGGGERG